MQNRPTDLITADTIETYLAGPPAESRDFDFLIGDWLTRTVRYDAEGEERLAHGGRWSARYLAGGRIVLDETVSLRDDGAEIASMATLRSYSPISGRWEMTFVSAHQPMLPISFVGRKVGDELQLQVRPVGDEEGRMLAKVRFYDIAPDRFEWEQRMSFDEGASYRRTVSIRAQRA